MRANQHIATVVLAVFFQATVYPVSLTHAQEVVLLPSPGVMVDLSPSFTPPHLAGITVYPNSPLQFDFIIKRGDTTLTAEEKQEEYKKLIKYFLASLAVPDENQWVNLSPYEKDRIVGLDFANTQMGRDLLGQDYILKQITSSLIYPEKDLGKDFWDKVYAEAFKQFGNTNIPVNTFNKVWIVPDSAVIYEKGNSAYVLKNHLKVMLEQDYVATAQNAVSDNGNRIVTLNASTSKVMRDVIIPVLEKEINEGKNFANLRQVYSGMLLAAWYKRVLKESFLAKVYADKSKLKGVDQDPKANQEIYQRYLQATKKGVYNFIKEDVDKYTQQIIPRKYFSGGMRGFRKEDFAMGSVRRLGIDDLTASQRRALMAASGSFDVAESGFVDFDLPIGDVDFNLEAASKMKASRIDINLEGNETPSTAVKNSDLVNDKPNLVNKDAAPKNSYNPGNFIIVETLVNLRSAFEIKNGYIRIHTDSERRGKDEFIENYLNEAKALYKQLVSEVVFDGKKGLFEISLSATASELLEYRMRFKTGLNIFKGEFYSNDPINLKALGDVVARKAEEILSSNTSERAIDQDRLKNEREGYDKASVASVNKAMAKSLGNAIYAGLLVADNAPDIATPTTVKKDKVGGIDFNASKLAMQIKRDGNGIVLPIAQQNWEGININGLTPVILEIKPALGASILDLPL